jgi:hypothetical protein
MGTRKRPLLPSLCAASLILPALACTPAAGPSRPPAAAPPSDLSTSLRVSTGDEGPLFSGTPYDEAIPTADKALGFPVGSRPAHHAEIVTAFRKWGEASGRVEIFTYGETYEGRELVLALISSERNLERLDAIKADLARLADPRELSEEDAERIVKGSPAIAWLGYSLHGDEISGADASVAVAHHLAAGESDELRALREAAVVVIDPVMNPDGRERILSQIEQSAGAVPNTDYASMHRGRWPWGRGNHYLFDMNRDLLAAVAPETQARIAALRDFNPQLHVDAHEMGPLDTYLFYPRSEPINPHFSPSLGKWTRAFAADAARAFDALGWSYYTRDWADGWYPGYADAWAALAGSIAILYEQSGVAGQPLRRRAGELVTYRESVQGHAVASVANVLSLSRNREAVLSDYLETRRAPLSEAGALIAVQPGRHPDRERAFVELLLRHGIEMGRLTKPMRCRDAKGSLGRGRERFEAGSLIVSTRQPQGALVRAFLELDTRLPDAVLLDERRELETRGRSKVFDVTAWDVGHAFDVDMSWCAPASVQSEPVKWPEPRQGRVTGDHKATAWVVDGTGDRSVTFAAHAMEAGLEVRVARKPFASGKRSFPAGTLLLRRAENRDDPDRRVAKVAKEVGIEVLAVGTGLSGDDSPDLGARSFELLHRPRIAVLTNAPVSPSAYGHVWHQLDRELGVPFSMIDAQSFARHDLRRYNVLVLPPVWHGGRALIEANRARLEAWIRGGGTLIAIAGSAGAVATAKLGSVRRRRDVLTELDGYRKPVERELAARRIEIDSAKLWDPQAIRREPSLPGGRRFGDARRRPGDAGDKRGDGEPAGQGEPDGEGGPGKGKVTKKETAEQEDKYKRLFSPRGVVLRGLVAEHEWITVGAGPELPVFFSGSTALMSRRPVSTPVRLASAPRVRLAGLLWPEARERVAETAYLTVERMGHGQIILFASPPSFRGYFFATARLLANALIYGPGLGARQPTEW